MRAAGTKEGRELRDEQGTFHGPGPGSFETESTVRRGQGDRRRAGRRAGGVAGDGGTRAQRKARMRGRIHHAAPFLERRKTAGVSCGVRQISPVWRTLVSYRLAYCVAPKRISRAF